jgi:hypothetical protein
MEQNKQPDLRILFIGKAGDFFSRQAADFILVHYPLANIIYSERNQPFPPELFNWKGDLIISYLSQWIIPQSLLQNAILVLAVLILLFTTMRMNLELPAIKWLQRLIQAAL